MIRQAQPQDRDGVVATVTAAFAEDPGWVFILGEEAWGRLTSYNDAVAEAVPAELHWYLGVLATKPERREEGLATALLSPILNEADRLGVACCLETLTVKNRRFYERRGFEQTREIILEGGPDTWWLRRDPKGTAAT